MADNIRYRLQLRAKDSAGIINVIRIRCTSHCRGYLSFPTNSVVSNFVYLFSAAAVFSVLVASWTLLAMLPTNDALDTELAAADLGTEVKDDSEVANLPTSWAGLNGVRAVFPLVGAVSGLWAITS
jgi:hypothetical protein